MDFLSLTFSVFFIISVVCYYCVPKKMRWGVLLLSSIVFYVWSVPYLIIYLLFSTVTTYAYGKWVENHRGWVRSKRGSRRPFESPCTRPDLGADFLFSQFLSPLLLLKHHLL